MITLKIFICLLYLVYSVIMAVTGILLSLHSKITVNEKVKFNKGSRFIFIMLTIDHFLLMYFTVSYILFLIGR